MKQAVQDGDYDDIVRIFIGLFCVTVHYKGLSQLMVGKHNTNLDKAESIQLILSLGATHCQWLSQMPHTAGNS